MFYLYHRVPRNLQGTTLYPLNQLKTLFPDVYEAAAKKYVGREVLMEQIIPYLDCKWNDVLNFSPVHPKQIEKALLELGIVMKGRTFFEVDPSLLEKEKTLIYLYSDHRVDIANQKEQFIPYDPELIGKFSELPEVTKEYYKNPITTDGKLLLWHLVPHILYKGTLDTSQLKRFTI